MDSALAELQEQTFAGATAATRASFPPERRLSARQLADYLDRRAFAVVSTTRPDGRPHSTLTSYVRRGHRFWLPTGAGTVREHNVRTRPWLSLVVTEGDRESHVVVLVEGPATVGGREAAPSDVAAAFPHEWVSAWLCLDARRVLSYAAEGVLDPP
ncbi:MAG TPA: pyridoxamine 5'-phosphate oxidase family protein [Streptosporangiales bacterium]